MPEQGFSPSHIFQYKDIIYDSVLIQKYTGQKKPVFWQILRSKLFFDSNSDSNFRFRNLLFPRISFFVILPPRIPSSSTSFSSYSLLFSAYQFRFSVFISAQFLTLIIPLPVLFLGMQSQSTAARGWSALCIVIVSLVFLSFVLTSSFVHLTSPALYLITAMALELITVATLLDFRLKNFLYLTKIIFSQFFLHFFRQLPVYLSIYIPLLQYFFMNSSLSFGSCILSFFDVIPLFIISVALLLIPDSIPISSLNVHTMLTNLLFILSIQLQVIQ